MFACSLFCVPFGGGLLLPLPDSAEVPVDARPVIDRDDGLVLVGPDGEPVDVDREPVAPDATRLLPLRELLPNARYHVLDEIRGQEVGAFTTGEERLGDDAPPVPEGLDATGSVRFDLRPGHSVSPGCGGAGEHVLVTPSWERTTGLYEVRAVRADGSRHTVLGRGETAELGWSVPCIDSVPELGPNETLSISVRSIDLLGRTSPWSDALLTSARDAEPGACSTGGRAPALALIPLLLAVSWRGRRPRP